MNQGKASWWHAGSRFPRRMCAALLLAFLGLPALAQPFSTNQSARGIGVTPVAAAAPAGNAGLFVGVNEFEDESLRPLTYAVNDAVAQAHLFVVELKLVSPANATVLLAGEPNTTEARTQLVALAQAGVRQDKATRTTLLKELLRARNLTGNASDLLVLSISSHGFEEGGVPYAMPSDGLKALLAVSALNLQDLEQELAKSRAGKRLLLLDACREKTGAEGRGGDAPMSAAFRSALAAAEGQAVMASCDVGQLSYEHKALGHGVFTHFLIEGMRGAAGPDRRGFITLGSVSDYVARSVNEWLLRNRPELPAGAVQKPWFKGPNDARAIPLAVSADAREDLAKARETVGLRLEKLTRMFLQQQITTEQLDQARRILESEAETMNEQDQQRWKIYSDLAEGRLVPEYLQGALDKVETPGQRTARLQREAAEKAQQEREAKITALLATAQENDSKEKGQTALAALDELLKLEPEHAEAKALRAKVAKYSVPSVSEFRNILEVQSEEEWVVIGRLLTDVYVERMEAGLLVSAQGNTADQLRSAVAQNASKVDIRTKLLALRAEKSRGRTASNLTRNESNLTKILTVKQEALATLYGLLP